MDAGFAVVEAAFDDLEIQYFGVQVDGVRPFSYMSAIHRQQVGELFGAKGRDVRRRFHSVRVVFDCRDRRIGRPLVDERLDVKDVPAQSGRDGGRGGRS